MCVCAWRMAREPQAPNPLDDRETYTSWCGGSEARRTAEKSWPREYLRWSEVLLRWRGFRFSCIRVYTYMVVCLLPFVCAEEFNAPSLGARTMDGRAQIVRWMCGRSYILYSYIPHSGDAYVCACVCVQWNYIHVRWWAHRGAHNQFIIVKLSNCVPQPPPPPTTMHPLDAHSHTISMVFVKITPLPTRLPPLVFHSFTPFLFSFFPRQ